MKRIVTDLFPKLNLIRWLPLLLLAACNSRQHPADRNSTEKEVVCFLYHRFDEERYPSTNTSTENFRAHLKYFKDHDFQVLSFSDAIDYLASDEPVQKTAVITIDDGYSSFFENGLPVLQAFGFPATLFINTQTVGGADYMGWEELKMAKNSRIEIGNHTHSHNYFLNLPPESRYETFRGELKRSQELIRQNLGVEAEVFAYPFGEYDLKMVEIVREEGFKGGALQKSGVIYSGQDLMRCPRFPMAEAYATLQQFAEKAGMHALRVAEVSDENPVLAGANPRPQLSLKTSQAKLQMDRLQCFIQGGDCEIIRLESGFVSVRAASAISGRRRTLYTITVPDEEGKWHWFSHLWIFPEVNPGS